jgi:2-methylisocitrate lyase-like PEP mutase family enzyme
MSKTSTAQKRAEFRALHQQGCFVLPNPRDVGSARMFQELGVQKKEEIAATVRAVAPQPVNVLVMNPAMTVAELAGLGVRRVSVGGSLALVASGATLAAAERMKAGSFEGLAAAMPGARLNDTFRGLD